LYVIEPAGPSGSVLVAVISTQTQGIVNPVIVGVCVGVCVDVLVGVLVCVCVLLGVAVLVFVGVCVGVSVCEAVILGVFVGVAVGVGVMPHNPLSVIVPDPEIKFTEPIQAHIFCVIVEPKN
jgi:hypothetical protein